MEINKQNEIMVLEHIMVKIKIINHLLAEAESSMCINSIWHITN